MGNLDPETFENSVHFWENYRLLVAEAVFFGVLAANGAGAFLRWVWERAGTWGRPSRK